MDIITMKKSRPVIPDDAAQGASNESKPSTPSPEASPPTKVDGPVRDYEVGWRLLLFFIVAVVIIALSIAYERWG